MTKMQKKRLRYRRNLKIRKVFKDLDLSALSEEEKDNMFILHEELFKKQIDSICVSAPDTFPTQCKKSGCIPQCIKENNMDANIMVSEQRRVLERELYTAKNKHDIKLEQHFNIIGKIPLTPKEAVEWVKADKFKYTDDELSDVPLKYENWSSYITFTEGEPDRRGYQSSVEKMIEDYNKINLRIKINDPKDMLKEVENFSTRTYH